MFSGKVGDIDVQFTNVSNTSAHIIWSVVNAGDFPPTGFNVSLHDDKGKLLDTHITDEFSTTFYNLTVFTSYIIEIFAWNSFNIRSPTKEQQFRTVQGGILFICFLV